MSAFWSGADMLRKLASVAIDPTVLPKARVRVIRSVRPGLR